MKPNYKDIKINAGAVRGKAAESGSPLWQTPEQIPVKALFGKRLNKFQ